MTVAEFVPICRCLITAYQRDNFLKDRESVDLWLKYLGDIDATVVSKAVDKYIMANAFQPTIADIRKLCSEIIKEETALRAEMREAFEFARGVYPGIGNKMEQDTMKIWNKLTAADTWTERVRKARDLDKEIATFVRNAEETGKVNDIPTFTGCLRSLYELHG